MTRYPFARLRMINTSLVGGWLLQLPPDRYMDKDHPGDDLRLLPALLSSCGTAWRRHAEQAGAECSSHFLATQPDGASCYGLLSVAGSRAVGAGAVLVLEQWQHFAGKFSFLIKSSEQFLSATFKVIILRQEDGVVDFEQAPDTQQRVNLCLFV